MLGICWSVVLNIMNSFPGSPLFIGSSHEISSFLCPCGWNRLPFSLVYSIPVRIFCSALLTCAFHEILYLHQLTRWFCWVDSNLVLGLEIYTMFQPEDRLDTLKLLPLYLSQHFPNSFECWFLFVWFLFCFVWCLFVFLFVCFLFEGFLLFCCLIPWLWDIVGMFFSGHHYVEF